jgi:hypothetical protein
VLACVAVLGLAQTRGGAPYAGFVGGRGPDGVNALAVDAGGFAYVAGNTDSPTGFPLRVGPDLDFLGPQDAFVAKIAPDGRELAYCGYVAGRDREDALDVAVGGDGSLYVVGTTTSPESSFPVAVGPGTTHGGGFDAFVARVSPDGRSLLYCGYVGGAGDDYGAGIAVGADGSAYVVGSTTSDETTFPVARGPGLTAGGGLDAFVAKV